MHKTLKTTIVFLFTGCSLLASSTSFAGYIQASNDQDFALLSTIIGDSTFNVTFSANGQLDFSYFAQHMMRTATLNLVDNNIFEGAGPVNVLAGTYSVAEPMDINFSLGGPLFVLPPVFADMPNVKEHPASQVVPDNSVVSVSSLMPVSVNTGCTNCGALPLSDAVWTPAPVSPPIRLSPFATPFSIFDATDDAPEPSTLALFVIALLGAGLFQFRRQYFKP
uniref:Ice-binding protein C-terminal domain-containing protein n=1 Tax=Solibacter usitatus (strain Ellin6076) TaxID=234267 RepID=Q01WK4_SOLUE